MSRKIETIHAVIDDILGQIEYLHRATGEPVDDLDRYEAMQAMLRIENALRGVPTLNGHAPDARSE